MSRSSVNTRSAKTDFRHGVVDIELTVIDHDAHDGWPDDMDDRLDTVMAAAGSIVFWHLIPAISRYVSQNVSSEQQNLGQDRFEEPVSLEIEHMLIKLDVLVFLEVDVPDDEVKAMIHKLVAIRCEQAIATAMSPLHPATGLMHSFADLSNHIVTAVNQVPDLVAQIVGIIVGPAEPVEPTGPQKPPPFEAGPVTDEPGFLPYPGNADD